MPDAPSPRSLAPDAGVARPGLVELLVAAAAIAALTAAVFVPSLLDPEACGKFDVYRAFGPWSYFFDRSVQSGDFPEWNPLTLSGTPFAANPQSWALYPPNVLRALVHLHPTPMGTLAGLAVLALLHVCVLGFGTYRLAREHGLSRSAAGLAMLGASLSALVVRRVAELHFVFTLAWLPFMLLSARRFVRASTPRERLHHGTWLAAVAALATLGGFPQLYPYLAAGVLAYAAAERVADPRVLSTAPSLRARARALRPLVRDDLAYALPAALLMLGLAACLLLPAEQFARYSARIASAKHAADGHLPEEWTLKYAFRSIAVYSGRRYEPETLRGAGIGVLALATAGVLGGVRRRTASFFAAFYVFVDLLIGAPMPIASLIEWLSPFKMVSATRAADVGLVFAALLAGCGLDALRSSSTLRRALACVAALGMGGAALRMLHRELERDRLWVEPSTLVLLVPAVLLLVAVITALAARAEHRVARALPFALVALVALELLAWNGPYVRALVVHRHFRRDWLSHTDVEGKNAFWPDNRRHADERPNFELFTLRGLINGYDPLHLRRVRSFLASESRGKRYERSVFADETLGRNARGPLWMKRAFWLVPAVVASEQPARKQLFPPTEVAFVKQPLSLVPTRPARDVLNRAVGTDAERIAVELPRLRPRGKRDGKWRARAVTRWVTIPARHAALELRVRARGRVHVAPTIERAFPEPFLPERTPALEHSARSKELAEHRFQIPLPDVTKLRATLELSWDDEDTTPELLELAVLSDVHDEDAWLTVEHRSADEVRVRVRELPAPRLLVFTDADYPGWHVEVDGKAAALVRTGGAFKGVELRAGAHEVRFHFRSPKLWLGLALSALALVISAVVLRKTRPPR